MLHRQGLDTARRRHSHEAIGCPRVHRCCADWLLSAARCYAAWVCRGRTAASTRYIRYIRYIRHIRYICYIRYNRWTAPTCARGPCARSQLVSVSISLCTATTGAAGIAAISYVTGHHMLDHTPMMEPLEAQGWSARATPPLPCLTS